MKYIYLIPTCLLLILITACTKETNVPGNPEDIRTITINIVPPGNSSENASAQMGFIPYVIPQTISLDDETRVAVTEANAPRFEWQLNETIPLLVLFRQSATSTNYATATATLKVTKASEPFKATFSVNLPIGYNVGTAQIAAVTGQQPGVNNGAWATGWSSPGVATIESAGVIDVNNKLFSNANTQYNIPLYFPLTPIPANGSVSVSFTMYGSLVAFKMTNTTSVIHTPASVSVNTTQFGTSGTMNLSTLSNGLPAWVGSGTQARTYALSNLSLAPNETKSVYIWANQESTNAQNIDLVYYDATTLFPIIKSPNIIFENGKSYRLTIPIPQGDGVLMLTESYIDGASKVNNRVEIYNPSSIPVSFTGYALVRKDATNTNIISTYSLGTSTLQPGTGNYNGNTPVSSILVCYDSRANSSSTVWGKTIRSTMRTISSNTSIIPSNQGEYYHLTKNGVTIDVIRVPETYLYLNSYSTRQRLNGINKPNPVYTPSEWRIRGGNEHSLGQRAENPSIW